MEGPTRRDRPCDACRRRKIRCLYASDEASQCVLCQSRGADCTFLQSPPRKKRALSYTKDRSRDTTSPKHRDRALGSEPATPIQDYSNLTGPTLLKRTLGHQNRQSCSYIGPTSDQDSFVIDMYPFDQNEEYRAVGMPGILRRVRRQVHYLMRVDTPTEIEQQLADIDQAEAIVTPHGPALVKLYFRIVHPSFPIIHKKVFLEKYSRTYRELTPLGLVAVYLLALDWWSYSGRLASLTKPNVQELETLASKLMADMHLRPKISDVQACLVIAQRPDGDSWARTGLLVSMAQTLGVHLDCSHWSIPRWEKGVRKRIAWSLFMQDKWGALIYGQPSHLARDNWEVKPLEPTDFPETAQDDDEEEGSSEIEVGKQIFLAMISLTDIVADVLDTLFTLKDLRRNLSTVEVLARAKPLQIRLKAWYAALPSALSMREPPKPRKLSSNGYLHLAYYTAEITLHRAVLRSHTFPGPVPTPNPTPDPGLIALTRAAARARFTAAVDFVQKLRPEHLQSFWYFSSKRALAVVATFGLFLWATSPPSPSLSPGRAEEEVEEKEEKDDGGEERPFYAARLAEYRWALRVSCTAAEFMRYTVARLDVGLGGGGGGLLESLGRDALAARGAGEGAFASSEMGDEMGEDWGKAFDEQQEQDGPSPDVQLDCLQPGSDTPYFDVRFEDLAGYAMEDFATFP